MGIWKICCNGQYWISNWWWEDGSHLDSDIKLSRPQYVHGRIDVSKQQFITGWMFLDGKAVFVKCHLWRSIKNIISVAVPRKYRFEIRSTKSLHKTEVACLRRNINIRKQVLVRDTEELEEVQRRVNQINYELFHLREQLKKANSSGK
jgi:hypothetical protein